MYTYADDTTLVITAETEQDLNRIAQTELNHLIHYFHRNNLVSNPTKTQYTVFHPTPTTVDSELQVNNKVITKTEQAPLLGVVVQKTLKHHQTITNIVKKLQPIIHKFRYANKLLPTHTMKQQYYSLAYPHFIGAISVWGTNKANSTRMQPLIRTQKKLIRLIKNLPPRTHTKKIMADLGILNVPNLYTLRVCVEMHAFIFQTKPLNRPEHNHNYISTAQIHDYPTRHSQKMHHYVPNSRQDPTHDMTFYTKQNTHVWNTVPLEIREIQSLDSFKKALTKHLLQQQTI